MLWFYPSNETSFAVILQSTSGESRGGARVAPLLFLDQTEAQRAKKNFFSGQAPLISESAPPSPHLKVWIH